MIIYLFIYYIPHTLSNLRVKTIHSQAVEIVTNKMNFK